MGLILGLQSWDDQREKKKLHRGVVRSYAKEPKCLLDFSFQNPGEAAVRKIFVCALQPQYYRPCWEQKPEIWLLQTLLHHQKVTQWFNPTLLRKSNRTRSCRNMPCQITEEHFLLQIPLGQVPAGRQCELVQVRHWYEPERLWLSGTVCSRKGWEALESQGNETSTQEKRGPGYFDRSDQILLSFILIPAH